MDFKAFPDAYAHGTPMTVFESIDIVKRICETYPASSKLNLKRQQFCNAIGGTKNSAAVHGVHVVASLLMKNMTSDAICEALKHRVYQDVCGLCFPKDIEEMVFLEEEKAAKLASNRRLRSTTSSKADRDNALSTFGDGSKIAWPKRRSVVGKKSRTSSVNDQPQKNDGQHSQSLQSVPAEFLRVEYVDSLERREAIGREI